LKRHSLCPRKAGALFRDLPGHADRLHRVARNVCGLKNANSSEFDPASQHRIIYKLRELLGVEEMGGTMRLGAWACILEKGSLAARAYGGATEISERHRHRYEFNREYEALLTGAGLRISGTTPTQPMLRSSNCRGIPTFWAASFIPSSSRSTRAASALPRVHCGELQEPADKACVGKSGLGDRCLSSPAHVLF